MDLGSQFRQYSSAEVDLMTDDEALSVRQRAGQAQRGGAENAMTTYQHSMGGGVMSHVMEHVGDLTNRMNKNPQWLDTTMEDTMPKVDRMDTALHHPYGFEREMGENLRSNAKYKGESEADHVMRHEHLAGRYADEHRKLPVYNYPSEVARDAAVAVGEQRFSTARHKIRELRVMEDGGKDPSGRTWAQGDMTGLLEHTKQGMVDYLRDKESRTPAITEAARVMLGGPK